MLLDEPEAQERRVGGGKDVGPHQIQDDRAVLLQLGLAEALELGQVAEAVRPGESDIDQRTVMHDEVRRRSRLGGRVPPPCPQRFQQAPAV